MTWRAGRVLLAFATAILAGGTPRLVAQNAYVQVNLEEPLGPLNIDHMSLGQGGLSDQPMWASRMAEIRALHPKLVRLFVQEYFDLLPRPGHYHFDTLDRCVDNIRATGATPLLCLCFKPRVLFAEVDQDVVEPRRYDQWEELVYKLVKHYGARKAGIQYWEVANEPDIGEAGGCPYRFKSESYARYYEHTARAIRRGDPQARVGGPALASSHSVILPFWLNYCETNRVPLDFVSWHIYSSDPKAIANTVGYVRGLLKQHPGLSPETILDEWNMDLTNPPLDPRFQPCFICETLWQMKQAGLDYSCYYHIRDWSVDFEQFKPFMSEPGTAFMARWWDRMPQFDGLFDFQDQVRPAYYAFKLLARLGGEALRVVSYHPSVHGFATHDKQLRTDNILLWNFSGSPAQVELVLSGIPSPKRVRHVVLDAAAAGIDENSRLRPDPFFSLGKGSQHLNLSLEPYAIHYWYLE